MYTEDEKKLVEGPAYLGGAIGRVVQFPDGSGQVETWGRDGRERGGADGFSMMMAPDASPARLRQHGVPEKYWNDDILDEDRLISKVYPEDQLRLYHGPVIVDGEIRRLVRVPFGGPRTEVWNGTGWDIGGTGFRSGDRYSVWGETEASADDLRQQSVPERFWNPAVLDADRLEQAKKPSSRTNDDP